MIQIYTEIVELDAIYNFIVDKKTFYSKLIRVPKIVLRS
jgi:hypothetical protein